MPLAPGIGLKSESRASWPQAYSTSHAPTPLAECGASAYPVIGTPLAGTRLDVDRREPVGRVDLGLGRDLPGLDALHGRRQVNSSVAEVRVPAGLALSASPI